MPLLSGGSAGRRVEWRLDHGAEVVTIGSKRCVGGNQARRTGLSRRAVAATASLARSLENATKGFLQAIPNYAQGSRDIEALQAGRQAATRRRNDSVGTPLASLEKIDPVALPVVRGAPGRNSEVRCQCQACHYQNHKNALAHHKSSGTWSAVLEPHHLGVIRKTQVC